MSIETMKQAFDDYMCYGGADRHERLIQVVNDYIAEAEKQEQGEPVAWLYQIKPNGNKAVSLQMMQAIDHEHVREMPLYTHPQPNPSPLTDEVIKLRGENGVLVGLLGAALQVIDTVDGEDAAECEMLMELQNKITYAIRAAHGIKE